MPRISRKILNTAYFHVMSQGINKSYIFDKAEDKRHYIKLMNQLVKEYNLKIIAYCVMSNHVHMLLHSENIAELSKFMQRLNLKYGKYYNKKYDRVGFVFRNRFRSEGIYGINHLYNCINYIYNNPVKAKICKNPSEYPFSNYKPVPKVESKKYVFIDEDEDKNENYIISQVLCDKNVNLNSLNSNKDNLKKIVMILKEDYGISLRKIANELHIGREYLRKLYNEK